jgi:glycerol-3-phosphate acyltransferase PlsY
VAHVLTAAVIALAATAAYLLGSIPTGPLVAQARGIDLRAVGSGNIGAANATRALGKPLGIAVFAGDALKGFAPALAARLMGLPPAGVALIGFAAFLGHLFPIYLRLRGGKGVATAAGIFFAMAPVATAASLVVWLLGFALWRIASLASLLAVLAFPAVLLLMHESPTSLACAGAVVLLIVWKHRANIRRLLTRSERKLTPGG